MTAKLVYLMCALTALACTVMLFRAYRRSGVRFLLWSTLCFLGLTLNNVMLFLDLVVFPGEDYSILRIVPAFAGLAALVYGLVTEVR